MFSATLPPLVASTAAKYMKADRITVDLVGKESNRTAVG